MMFFLALVLLGAPGALAVACNNPAPGLEKQAHGVDVTKLDLMPVNPVTADDGFKRRVFTYTCDKGDKVTVNGKTYDRPDQVSSVYTIPSGSLTSSVTVHKTSEETRNSMSVNAGISGTIKKFAFSVSTTYSQTQRNLLKRDKTVQTASANFGARRMDLKHKNDLTLGTVAQRQLDNLPSRYSDNPAAYEEFVEEFGTHYISSANFGGLIMQYMETSSEYIESHSEQSLSVEASASYAELIKVHGGTTTTSSSTSSEFNSHTKKTVRYYGGSANLLDSNGISAWQPTIDSNPWLFSTELAPLSDLVRDAKKRKALETATEDYVLRSYLTVELPRILDSLPAGVRGDASVTNLRSNINTMANKRPLVASEVSALGQRVENKFKELYYDYYRNNVQLVSVNSIMKPLNFTCGAGKVLSRIWSHHSDWHDDRTFKLGCSYPPTLPVLTNCRWTTEPVNGWLEYFSYTCPHDGLLKGMQSVHSDWHDDRNFNFKCCQADRKTVSCSWTDYENKIMSDLDYTAPYNKVIAGVASVHSDWHDDRRFKFYTCALNSI